MTDCSWRQYWHLTGNILLQNLLQTTNQRVAASHWPSASEDGVCRWICIHEDRQAWIEVMSSSMKLASLVGWSRTMRTSVFSIYIIAIKALFQHANGHSCFLWHWQMFTNQGRNDRLLCRAIFIAYHGNTKPSKLTNITSATMFGSSYCLRKLLFHGVGASLHMKFLEGPIMMIDSSRKVEAKFVA